MLLTRTVKSTLTPCTLDHGDTLRFLLSDGSPWDMTLLRTSAAVCEENYRTYPYHAEGDISAYTFDCDLLVNGREVHLQRWVGNQDSFYAPEELDGVRVWFDAVAAIFVESGGFMREKDWRGGLICNPNRAARFAVQEAGRPICPEPLCPWYPNPSGKMDIHDCYNGEDCWMGPYQGAFAHCGLDVNMPAGTLLTAPISLDDQYFFNTLGAGDNNNRWRGIRRWADGSEWWLQSHHLIELLVPERTPLTAGTPYATTAGVLTGAHEHTHFIFEVLEQGGSYKLDAWILLGETWPAAGREGGR
jgi:hypothetical protein